MIKLPARDRAPQFSKAVQEHLHARDGEVYQVKLKRILMGPAAK
jgi:hypothetical protein